MPKGRKPLKVGVKVGKGAPPGYQWSVGVLDLAHRESIDVLAKPGQRQHIAQQVRELARQAAPSTSETIDIRPIEGDVFEIRDYGGVLGGLNIRVFFGVDHARRVIVVLGVFKKQNDGPTPLGDKVRNLRRWRCYLNGDFGSMD